MVLVVARERLKQTSKLLIEAKLILVVKQRFELPDPLSENIVPPFEHRI